MQAQPLTRTAGQADYLVRRGIPFRETHHIAGQVVALAEKKGARARRRAAGEQAHSLGARAGTAMSELSLAELQEICPTFEEDVGKVWNYEASVESRDVAGGTSRAAVLSTAAQLREWAGVADDSTRARL